MNNRENHKQTEYAEMLEKLSLVQREELKVVQEEIGWSGNSATNNIQWPRILGQEHPDQSKDSDWSSDDEDEDPLVLPRVTGAPVYTRHWAERLANEQRSWERQMSSLCNALLTYCRNGLQALASVDSGSTSEQISFELECLFLTEKKKIRFTSCDPTEPTNVTLMRHGFLSPTPNIPKLAIHVDVLGLSVALRRHASALSVQAIAASLSELYNVPYMRHLRTQLSNAMDVYLALLRMINSRVNRVLNQHKHDWRIRNACAACTYHLDGEPELKYSMLVTLDGNDSLKRVATSAAVDRRTFKSDYFLDSEYVNRFENEVKIRAVKKGKSKVSKVSFRIVVPYSQCAPSEFSFIASHVD
ncbi:hypothetical protein CTheo_8853 [Ceratobasidium theobromae]|uniref:Uncharacterized protein n=1 Tax=Ceratobasidium theobromae TaxID=1582974 RepID=A0A5N5Q8G9_9AGAM|nr:hypothetical protein CTheo_8853 [Ceratobasidium theobromae]